MRRHLRSFIVPAYILLCLLMGGSAQGIWRNMILQLIAVGLIAWAAISKQTEPLTRASKALLFLAAAAFAVFVLQLVPLPPEVWQRLPGRSFIAAGDALLLGEAPWRSGSIAPYDTLQTSLTLLPPVAVFLGITRLGAYEDRWLVSAILLGTFLNVLLGAIQTVGGDWPRAWWFLYELTNPGAVGFFANRNHTGTLLLVSIPFSALLFSSQRSRHRGSSHGRRVLGAAGLLLGFVGLALNHSLAALALAIPVILLSTFLLPRNWQSRSLIVGVVFVLAAIIALAATIAPVRSELMGSDTTSFAIRSDIWSLTWKGIQDTFPFGTGFGTFADTYPLYEYVSSVDRTYINHAHNDYLELVLEAGLPGLLLIIAFLMGWFWSVVTIWRSHIAGPYARAATIASGAILAHSVVDYPLRTAAIASIFAASVALMVRSGTRQSAAESDHMSGPRHHII